MIKKRILIAGGTGFLGEILTDFFRKKGHVVNSLTRHPKKKHEYRWDGKNTGDWTKQLEGIDVLINLAGKSVDCRYNTSNKNAILTSRIESTAVLAKAIKQAEKPPKLWINSSSATIYVHAETQQMTEDRGIIGDGFSMNVCKRWEEEFYKHDLNTTRRVAIRTAIVLGNEGGAYPPLKKLTKLMMGGKQGDGQQYVSWIHALDFCRSVNFISTHQDIVGSINLAAPYPVRNAELMKFMRSSLKRRIGIGQSKWALEFGAALLGTETELLLKSRNVIPERLLEKGFKFEFEKVEKALNDLAKK